MRDPAPLNLCDWLWLCICKFWSFWSLSGNGRWTAGGFRPSSRKRIWDSSVDAHRILDRLLSSNGFKWHNAWYLEMCQNCGIKIGGVTSIKNRIFTLFFHVEEFQHGIPPISHHHKPPTTRAVQVRSSVSCERTWCIRCSRNSIAVRWSQDCWPSVAKHLNTWTGLQLGQKVAI